MTGSETGRPEMHSAEIAETQTGWGVFCSGCSADEGDYVYPCRRGWPDPVPPSSLVDATEVAAAREEGYGQAQRNHVADLRALNSRLHGGRTSDLSLLADKWEVYDL